MDETLNALVNRPILMEPRSLGPLVAQAARLDGDAVADEQKPSKEALVVSAEAERRDGYWLDGGVGIIPVMGPLAHRSYWRTSYDSLSIAHAAAQADSDVQAIAWLMDSPGGLVSGVFDFADEIYQARGNKPMTAIVSELSASAAYLIASAIGEITLPRTGEVGSIGVVMQHWDFSGAMESMGIGHTYIYAGDHKVDGNPFQPMPKSVRERFQDEIDHVYGMFVDAAARNRGLTREAVIGTQALTYIGERGVAAGLADKVESPKETLERLKKTYGAAAGRLWNMSHHSKETNMADTTGPAEAGKTKQNGEQQKGSAAAETEANTGAAAAPGAAQADAEQPTPAPAAPNAASPEQVVSMAQEAGLGQFAADWISAKLTEDQVTEKIGFAQSVKDKCAAANVDPEPYLATGGDSSKLLDMAVTNAAAAAGGEEVANGVGPGAVTGEDPGWGKAFEQTSQKKF